MHCAVLCSVQRPEEDLECLSLPPSTMFFGGQGLSLNLNFSISVRLDSKQAPRIHPPFPHHPMLGWQHFWKWPTLYRGAGDLNKGSCFHSKNSYLLSHIPRPILASWCLLISNYPCHISESCDVRQSILIDLYWGISETAEVTTALEHTPPALLLTNRISRNVNMSIQTYSLIGIITYILLSIGNRKQDVRHSTSTQFVIQWLQGLFLFLTH